MRNPNGYGSVYKLSGKRRHPWAVRKTVGFRLMPNGQAYPKYEFLGYYATRKEATEALIAIHSGKEQTTINPQFSELYTEWSLKHFEKVSASRQRDIRSVWRYMSPLFAEIKIKDLKIKQANELLRQIKSSAYVHSAKIILSMIYDYAIQQAIIEPSCKDFLRYIDLSDVKTERKLKREIFTQEEVNRLWANKDNLNAKMLLILLYTGLRSSEFISLTRNTIKLEDNYLDIVKAKTKAGIRQVPIATKIKSLFTQELIERIEKSATKTIQLNLADYLKENQYNHNLHDTRHTFITNLTQLNIDERIIKQIVGHATKSVTQSVYTHIDLQTKLDVVNKL